MDKKIHDILQNAGAAKGISLEECFLLLATKNPTIIKNFEQRLDQEVQNGNLPKEKKEKAMLQIENAAEKISTSEKKYFTGIIDAFDKSFISLAQEEINTQQARLNKMEAEVHSLLS